MRDQRRALVVDLARIDDHPDLAPGTHREYALDALVASGDLLKVAKAPDVLLERVAAGARACTGDGVGGLDDHGLDRARLDLAVVSLHRVGDRLGLAAAPGDLPADEGMRALDLVGDRLADVVQQRRPARGLDRGAEFVGHQRRELRALDQVVEDVLAVAGAEAQLAEQAQQLRVEAVDAGLERRLLALLGDPTRRSRRGRARRSPRSALDGCARRRSGARASRGRSRAAPRRSSRAGPRRASRR